VELDQKNQALEWLEEDYEKHDFQLVWLKTDTILAPLSYKSMII